MLEIVLCYKLAAVRTVAPITITIILALNTTVADFFQLAYSKLNSTTRTRPDPRGLCRRPARTQRSFAAKKVRAGPVGSVSGPCSGI